MAPHTENQTGQILVELLIAFGLSLILLPVTFTGFISGRSGKVQQIQRTEALGLLKEAEEAMRVFREAGWTAFAVNGVYHPRISGTTWILEAGEEPVNGYNRTITIENAFRDAAIGQVVEAGGIPDPSTKKITLKVSWGILPVDAVSTSYYLTRYLDNLTWIQTTEADFSPGILVGTTVTNVAGGEVQLGSGGRGDWCDPELTINPVNLDRQGVANGITAIEGQVFAGTGENASGPSFNNVIITDTNPPSGSVEGSFDGFKTNGVFGETDFAYLATDTNKKQGVIIDLNDFDPVSKKYSEEGTLDLGSASVNGQSISVSGSYVYLTGTDGKLYVFDILSRSGEHSSIKNITLAGVGNKIFIIGTYAYVAIDSAATQMQIIDISNPVSPQVVGSARLDALAGVDVFVNSDSTRAYVATKSSTSQAEFFVIDITDKSGTKGAIGSYDANGMNPKGLTAVTGNRAIEVGIGGILNYQVIDLTDETNPVICTSGGRSGGLYIASGINGIASVLEEDGDAFSYIITGDADAELKIIEGGPGGQFAGSGTFESSIFDAGGDTAFNRFLATVAEPGGTGVKFQFAGADPVLGTCDGASFTFVGPDKTSSTFFEATGAIPLDDDGIAYENPARCFKYKAFLDSQTVGSTPIVYDVTVNYSP